MVIGIKVGIRKKLLEQEFEFSATFKGDKQSSLELGAVHRNCLHKDNYYQETQMTIWGELTPVAGVTPSLFIRYGDQIDYSNEQLGTRLKIASDLTWQINQHLQLEAKYSYSYLTVDAGVKWSSYIMPM